jgi:hypothetical protein
MAVPLCQSIMAALQTGDKHVTVPPMESSLNPAPMFVNDNGLVLDSAALLEERRIRMQWSEAEETIFYDKFSMHERHEERFAKITSALQRSRLGSTKKHGDVVQVSTVQCRATSTSHTGACSWPAT